MPSIVGHILLQIATCHCLCIQILASIQHTSFWFFFPVTGLGQIFRNLNSFHNIINYFCVYNILCASLRDNMLSAPLPDDMSSTPLPDDMSSAPLLDDVSSAPLPDDMSSAPLPDDVSSAPLLDDMSSALQRNRSNLFEVSEASNRSTRQLFWFIWLFDW